MGAGVVIDLEELHERLKPMFGGSGGIDSWLFGKDTPAVAIKRLRSIDEQRLSYTELEQFLIMSGLDGFSQGFFRYYWAQSPEHHPYDVGCCGTYEKVWGESDEIRSLDHFIYGWTRFYTDALLYFGDINRAYRSLHSLKIEELEKFFVQFRVNTEDMLRRGPRVQIGDIPRDDRYLIAELACKTLAGDRPLVLDDLEFAYRNLYPYGDARVQIKKLIEYNEKIRLNDIAMQNSSKRSSQYDLEYAVQDYLDLEISSTTDIREQLSTHMATFNRARETALDNTLLYLGMVKELDVYVATSMRTRQNFRDVAAFCESIFGHTDLTELNVRYFDPTMSAASGHEDKGLIECLMVRSAKTLIYSAQKQDSWGKDAEAAMALTQGKPVIFFCDEETRKNIFDNIHPLSRLISFDRGIAVGAMVVSKPEEVVKLLSRTFTNTMQYKLTSARPGSAAHLRLEEDISRSTVRIQTESPVLRSAIRNAYGLD